MKLKFGMVGGGNGAFIGNVHRHGALMDDLAELAKEKMLLFGMAYTYTGYAMVKQARELIDAGEIGNILTVVAEYPQEWLLVQMVSGRSDQAVWRIVRSSIHPPVIMIPIPAVAFPGCPPDIPKASSRLLAIFTGAFAALC